MLTKRSSRSYTARVASAITPPLRRDAQRNRERIITATRAAFEERGLDVGVDEIARRAGVGMGTLYRHFPTKDALIDAIVDARFEQLTAAADEALKADDPWEGFERFLVTAVVLQASDRGFKDALAARGRDERGVKAARRRLRARIARLLERGQAAGAIRADLDPADVTVLLWASSRVVERTADVAPGQARRFLAFHLDGMRTSAGGATPEVPAMTSRQLGRAMAPGVR
jgi:AcrR family transcriptional regulator